MACQVFRGQWIGTKKQGIGSYLYPRKAKYEGQWHDNVKDGFGVWYFPKGGLYKVPSIELHTTNCFQ